MAPPAMDDVVNGAIGILASPGIDASQTTVPLQDASRFDDPVNGYIGLVANITDFPIPVDDPNHEYIRVNAAKSGNTLNVLRGQEGTAAKAHNTAGKEYLILAGPTALIFSQIKTWLQLHDSQFASTVQRYDVKQDYGAAGDGVTDDTAKIQAAVDAADAAGGGTIWFPRGTYLVDQGRITRTSTSPIAFLGAGRKVSKLVWNPATDTPAVDRGMFNIAGAGDAVANHGQGVTFRDLSFDFGGARGDVSDGFKRGLNLYNCDDYHIVNCDFKGCKGETLGLGNFGAPPGANMGRRAYVAGCFFEDYVQSGINPNVHQAVIKGNHFLKGAIGIEAGRDDLTIIGNDFRDMTSYAIGVASVKGFVVCGNRMDDSVNDGTGLSSPVGSIFVQDQGGSLKSQQGVISGNVIENPTDHAFQAGIVASKSAGIDASEHINIFGNTIDGTRQGIYASALKNSIVTGNLVVAGAASSSGIVLDSGPDVVGNRVFGNYAKGSFSTKSYVNNSPASQNNVMESNYDDAGRLLDIVDKAASATIEETESGKTITNNGATGIITLTLPPLQAGLHYRFVQIAGNFLRIDPNGTEQIRGAPAGGKYMQLESDGTVVIFEYIGAARWEAHVLSGTTSFEP